MAAAHRGSRRRGPGARGTGLRHHAHRSERGALPEPGCGADGRVGGRRGRTRRRHDPRPARTGTPRVRRHRPDLPGLAPGRARTAGPRDPHRARQQLFVQHPSLRGRAGPGGGVRRRDPLVRGGRHEAGARDLSARAGAAGRDGALASRVRRRSGSLLRRRGRAGHRHAPHRPARTSRWRASARRPTDTPSSRISPRCSRRRGTA